VKAYRGIGLLFVWASCVYAEPVTDLYETHIVVPVPQNPRETHAALREALLTVVVRVSGQPDTRNNKYILSKADAVERYVDSYNYTATEKASVDEPQKIPRTQLNVSFAPRLIDQLLVDAKFSAWKEDRPLLLVLAKEEDGGFASTRSAKNISRQLQQALNERGVLYVLPSMDADDLLVMGATFATPSADQWDLLQQRYHYQAVLLGEVAQQNKEDANVWSGRWQLMIDNHTIPLDQADSDQAGVIAQTVDQAANVLKTAAVQANKTRTFTVTVQGIYDDTAYQKVRGYLEKLTSADSVKFMKTEGQTVVYQVIGKSGLGKLIAADQVLLPDGVHQNTDTQLYYAFNDVL
jgi:hypothetical protein